MDHDQYFSRLNNAKNILYNEVAIAVMSFQCEKQALNMVRCTGATRWRIHKPPRNDTVLPWMGTSPNHHLTSTAGCIPARLSYLFLVEDADSSNQWLSTLIPMYATGPIFPTAAMVIAEEKHQPPMEPLHNRRNCRKPQCSVEPTYVVPICVILGAVYLLSMTPQPDSSLLYLSNKINLNSFNWFSM
jgi:hypothetical protein